MNGVLDHGFRQASPAVGIFMHVIDTTLHDQNHSRAEFDTTGGALNETPLVFMKFKSCFLDFFYHVLTLVC